MSATASAGARTARRIAYWQFDTTGVGIFSLINDTDTLYPVITRIPYPKVGTTNSAARIGVVSADGGKTKWMQTPGDPRQHLSRAARVGRREHGRDPAAEPAAERERLPPGRRPPGAVHRVFRDESKTWVEVVDGIEWIDESRAFLWVTERDGWRHVYRVPGGPRKRQNPAPPANSRTPFC